MGTLKPVLLFTEMRLDHTALPNASVAVSTILVAGAPPKICTVVPNVAFEVVGKVPVTSRSNVGLVVPKPTFPFCRMVMPTFCADAVSPMIAITGNRICFIVLLRLSTFQALAVCLWAFFRFLFFPAPIFFTSLCSIALFMGWAVVFNGTIL